MSPILLTTGSVNAGKAASLTVRASIPVPSSSCFRILKEVKEPMLEAYRSIRHQPPGIRHQDQPTEIT